MIIGAVFLAYVLIAVVYSIRMENDDVLKKIYKAKSHHDWSEISFAVGFAWPLAMLIHYVMRRRNETV